MHASDALMSPPVALGAGLISITLIAVASRRVKTQQRSDIIPLMGVMGAFVFAAQMINFSIPGTGSSGHLIGGILLSAILGPWAAFIALSSIIIVQALFFADGGIMALGCNILNMAATSCLIAYPFIFKPLVGNKVKPWRIALASILASVVALEIGALGVTVETELSGVTALPFATFIKFMLPIHLVIGCVEGLVTASLLIFLASYRPGLLGFTNSDNKNSKKIKPLLIGTGIATLILAGGFTYLASENPDGLEWSLEKVSGIADWPSFTPDTAFMPDYDSQFAGIIGAIIVMALVWGLSSLIFAQIRRASKDK